MRRFHFIQILWLTAASLLGAAEQETITFCCYNLKNYLGMERTVRGVMKPDTPKPAREIAAVVRFLADIQPDVLGVSEIGTEEDLKDLQTRLAAAGVDLPHSEHCHGGDPVRHLGLLSRFPIAARNSQTDQRYLLGDQIFPVQRGFLDCSIEVQEGFTLRCVGVHLKSKRPVPEADQALMRRNESHLLRKHLDGILSADPEAKLLLYGDLNDERNSPGLVEIAGVRNSPTGMQDLFLADSRKERWTHYWRFEDLYSRLDYIFVSPTLSSYVLKKDSFIYENPDYYTGSDHRPLVTKIQLAKVPTKTSKKKKK